MNKREAKRLYKAGEEPTVAKLLEYDGEIKKYDSEVKRLSEENRNLNGEIRSLKERIIRLEKNSRNSSQPPSSDKPKDKATRSREKKKRSKRNPGGQPGHKGSNRKMVPPEEVDEIIDLYPEECDDCHKPLPQDGTGKEVGSPDRGQVTEIPPVKPKVKEYRAHTTECDCGCRTTAKFPPEVTASAFGPRLAGIIAYMTAVLRVPRRSIQEFCETLLGVEISLGSVQNLLESTSSALEGVDVELRDALPNEPVVNADETGWRDRWLWVFVNGTFVYFHVAKTRSSKVLSDIFGKLYTGILCCDRWGAYSKYHKGRFLQICWAHLKRDFKGVLETGRRLSSGEAICFAERMEQLRKKLMAMWYRFREGEMSRTELIKKTEPTRDDIEEWLMAHKESNEKCVQTLACGLLKRFDHLFTFILHEGVEPTNNVSERGIRPAVQWRKICFGNRSDKGAVLTSRLLTATRTCWLQKRNPLEFLVEAISAYRVGGEAPSLLMKTYDNRGLSIASGVMR